jgi:ribosomal protein S18 acetylase RimI-like enzyme
MADPLSPQPAPPQQWAAAFRLVFASPGQADTERRISNALRLVHSGEIDPGGIFVVAQGERLLAAIVCVALPGASGLIWPPGCAPSALPYLEDTLVQHGRDWLRRRGVKLLQCLLSPEEAGRGAVLDRNGFRAVTRLWYLRHDLQEPRQAAPLPRRLTFVPYDGGERFHHTLEQTYEDSQDCPEIHGVRTLEEILQGHRAQGRFDPGRWWLAHAGAGPTGVLLLTELPETGEWEVSYMGVVPAARRQGFGREMLQHALEQARAADAGQLVLSVDARNEPAWLLYRGMGFRPSEQRLVYLAIERD